MTLALSTPLGPVTYTVLVNGVLYNQQPQILDVQLVEEYESHDMMYLRIEYPPQMMGNISRLSIWPADTPIQVTWGRVPDVRTFYGYINHHEINHSADSGTDALQLTYVCIGTSAVLNSAKTRKWENITSTYVASQIAAENNMRAVTTPSSTMLTYEVQAGESDFHFLCRIADKTGMRFWVSGGTLYMINPTTAISGTGQSAVPQFSANKAIGLLDTCRNFKQLRGNNMPGSVQANRVVYGIDASTGKQFSASAPPANGGKRIAIKTTYASTNYSDAKARVDAWSAVSQFWAGATAQLYGNTRLYPGKIIQLIGGALPDGAAGIWLVSKATHNLVSAGTGVPNMDTYIVDVTLLRNTQSSDAITLANSDPVTPEFNVMSLNVSGDWTATNSTPVSLT